MAKILRLPSKTNSLLDFLDKLRQKVEKGEIITLLVAGHTSYGDVVAGWVNLGDVIQRQELVAHLQIDVIKSFVEGTYGLEPLKGGLE